MTDPAIPGVSRHYITLGDRQLHYLRAGTGPAVLLFHRTPRSARDLLPLIQTLSDRHTVLAPDIAGYGGSWPLAIDDPSVDAYADDVIAFMDGAGVARAAVYGEQTGACIALEVARRAPQKVAGLVLTDMMVEWWADSALSRINLKPFVPSWDGSHYAWLWAFLRDEATFEPFFIRDLAHRLDQPLPGPQDLQERVTQFISSGVQGRGYEKAFVAALAWDVNAALADIQCPVHVLAVLSKRQGGLVDHLKVKSEHKIEIVETIEAAHARTAALFADWTAGGETVPQPAPVKPIKGKLWNDYVSVQGGQMHLHCNTDPGTVPVFIQHDAASSIGTVSPITQSFLGMRSVFAVDMPGSGQSDNLIGHGCDADVPVYAEALGQTLDGLGIKTADFYGMWGGGFVGLERAIQKPDQFRLLILSNVFQTPDAMRQAMIENYTPDVSPVWHGGHLQQIWHQMRDQATFFPWWDKSRDGIIWKEPFIDTAMVHERTCSLIKAGNMYATAYHAHFRYPTHERLRASPVPTFVASTPWDPQYEETKDAATAAPNCTFLALSEDFTKWGTSFLDTLETADAA